MEQIKEQSDVIPESSAARLAFYTAFIPLAGFLFYMALGFLALIQIIGHGQNGFHRLSRGLLVVLFLSVVPIVGLILWAELPQEYYLVLNTLTKHGCVESTNQRQVTQREYFRFGKSFRRIVYRYYENGQKRSEAYYIGDKLEGTFTYWYDNGKPRLIETFANNRRHGFTSWFDKNGNLERSMNYVGGISQEQIDAAKKASVPPVIEEDLGGGVKMKMVYIPAGEFLMGSPDNEQDRYEVEGPQHKVTIRRGYYICATEITQAQWNAVMGDNPSYFKDGEEGTPKDTSSYPVEGVSWDNIQEYLMKLNAKGKGTFRLPSEAEWEYACRANTTTRFSFGDEYRDLGDYAWYDANSGGTTHPVAGKIANYWGLFDMHGNVWEWCADDYHETYRQASDNEKPWIDDPRGEERLLRGGSWSGYPKGCRTAYRGRGYPGHWGDYFGFRCAMTP